MTTSLRRCVRVTSPAGAQLVGGGSGVIVATTGGKAERS